MQLHTVSVCFITASTLWFLQVALALDASALAVPAFAVPALAVPALAFADLPFGAPAFGAIGLQLLCSIEQQVHHMYYNP